MLLDFKGPPLDSATSPCAAQVWARGKVGVRKALSWDRRHARHNTPVLLFSNRWIYLFVLSYSHRYQVGRDTTPPGGQRQPQSTHTGQFSPERDQRRYSVGQEQRPASCSWVSTLIPRRLF